MKDTNLDLLMKQFETLVVTEEEAARVEKDISEGELDETLHSSPG